MATKNNATVEIYEIIDPRDGSVRYIGKSVNSAARFKQHLRETRRKTPLYAWIAKMRAMGLTPTFRIAQVCALADWEQCERDAIAAARASNNKLLNVADGGDMPHCPPEVRAANARKMNERIKDDPRIAFIKHAKRVFARAYKEGTLTEERKAQLRYCAMKRPELFGAWASYV